MKNLSRSSESIEIQRPSVKKYFPTFGDWPGKMFRRAAEILSLAFSKPGKNSFEGVCTRWPIWTRNTVDIKLKVPLQYKLLILKQNSQFEVN